MNLESAKKITKVNSLVCEALAIIETLAQQEKNIFLSWPTDSEIKQEYIAQGLFCIELLKTKEGLTDSFQSLCKLFENLNKLS